MVGHHTRMFILQYTHQTIMLKYTTSLNKLLLFIYSASIAGEETLHT